ncbi:MAG: Flp pilus assembly complex ATPase component TadA, partial [Phycisphaerales bacterium]|nr:Flp pilus assembly complex ATPase component TadA [Phycisphaerales bacterium]
SDLHFTPTPRAGMVRLRIDGRLAPYLSLPKAAFERLVGLLANEGSVRDLVTTREALFPPPADLAGRYGFRVQLTQTVRGVAAVIRVLDRQSPVVEFDSLGFDPESARQLRRWASTAEGMVLVTGPTGSGKTTTLFALMRLVDGLRCSVHAVENPVELHCSQWHQSQVQAVGGVTEAEAFRTYAKGFLRSDPDVCLVGELRDLPAVDAAIDLAGTGHLVYATVHANGAPQTLQRLRHLGVSSEAVSAVLTGVLAQRLVPRLCPQCREPGSDADTAEALR